MLTVGSTFTGVGGADLGLERAGFSVAWQCELDAWKRSVLAAHWPNVPIHDDITTLHDPPPVDLMIGGFPCQDLSVAGKRKGFDGERSVLAFEFLRVAESVAPRWILLENVPGLLTSNRGRDFARLVDEMVGCGYGVAWRILDARYFGVPQRRRRVFLVARRADALVDSGAASRLALRALWEGGSGDPTPGWPPREDAPADAGGSSQSGRVYSPHGDAAEPVTGTLTRMYAEQSGQDFGGGLESSRSTIFNATAQFGAWVEDEKAGTLSRRDHKSSNHLLTESPIAFSHTQGMDEQASHRAFPTLRKGEGGHAVSYRKSKRAQTDQDDETWVEADETNTLNRFDTGDTRATQLIANALDRQAGGPDDNSAQAGHLVSEQTMVRRLTPVECERLMGWPDNWTAPNGVKAPDSKRYAACGDGIVSWVAYWIGQRIRMIEEEA
jgi:DNA (cytosine-5)-methyltransferase 1